MLEKVLEETKNINTNQKPTIKVINDTIVLLNEAIERLTTVTRMMLDVRSSIFKDDIKQFETSIKKNSEVKKIIEEASLKGKNIILKVFLVKKDKEVNSIKNFFKQK